MQGGERVGLVAAIPRRRKARQPPKSSPDTIENPSSIPMRMNAFMTRLPMLSLWLGTHWSRVTSSLVFHLCEQPFGGIRVGRR